MADARQSTVLGSTIGKHRIVRLVGGGVVGRVFACVPFDFAEPTTVAVKVLRTKFASYGDRLMRDRMALEKIQSPHVVAVQDVAVYSNVPYIVMELVEGGSLAELLQKGPLRSADALALARAVCLGLQAAWAQGIAHGDVRPQNVLLPNGDPNQAKVGDFLLAPPVEGTEDVRGSPAYLAPELLVGTPPDPLSDLYAVGSLLYECITGKTPFTGSAAAILHAQVNTPPPSLAATVPGPQGLVDLVDRLLEKDRSKRVKTYAECLDGIDRALKGMAMPAPKKPQVPELDVDMDIFDGEGATFEEGTAEIHTSPARDALDDSSPPAPKPAPKKPASAPAAAPLATADEDAGEDDLFGTEESGELRTRVQAGIAADRVRDPAPPASAPPPTPAPPKPAPAKPAPPPPSPIAVGAPPPKPQPPKPPPPEPMPTPLAVAAPPPPMLSPVKPVPSAEDLGLVLEEVPVEEPEPPPPPEPEPPPKKGPALIPLIPIGPVSSEPRKR
jgi:serine/threonine-protein kinase